MTSTSGDLVSELTMNKNSQLAFLASVAGIGPDLRRGLFATDLLGGLHAIVLYGDTIEVSPGVFRQVDGINFDGGRFRPASGFNDLGQIAFTLQFTDGSAGVFTSNLVAVPEPGAVALIGALAMPLVISASRRNYSV